jgi:putative tryptophan/tyrosine transport system substrate-binding protein
MRRRTFISMVGASAAWPLAARAQQPAIPMIGFLNSLSPESAGHLVGAFERALSEAGYVAGRNVAVEYRWALGQYDLLPAMAAEFARRPVAVLVATGGEPAALAAKAATSTIPIVFSVGSDPVKLGLVASYNRPSGNATGINLLTETLETKRLGILRELLPHTSTVAVLTNPKFPPAAVQLKQLQEAAQAIGIHTEAFHASTDAEIAAVFQSLAQRKIPALIVATEPFFQTRGDDLIALAARHRLPTMYGFRELALVGGLASYGISLTDAYRQLAFYVGRILKGEKPADLPVMQPTKFELVINAKTAKALSLDVPDKLLALADEVIE